MSLSLSPSVYSPAQEQKHGTVFTHNFIHSVKTCCNFNYINTESTYVYLHWVFLERHVVRLCPSVGAERLQFAILARHGVIWGVGHVGVRREGKVVLSMLQVHPSQKQTKQNITKNHGRRQYHRLAIHTTTPTQNCNLAIHTTAPLQKWSAIH